MVIKMGSISNNIILMDIITVLLGILILMINLLLFDTDKNNIDKKK